MTDLELIEKKLALIETCVQELRDLARPERLSEDVREARFVEHTLQIAIRLPGSRRLIPESAARGLESMAAAPEPCVL